MEVSPVSNQNEITTELGDEVQVGVDLVGEGA